MKNNRSYLSIFWSHTFMHYKSAQIIKNNTPIFNTNAFDNSLVKHYVSHNFLSSKPIWNKIIQSSCFKCYSNLDQSCDLFQTDFPDYLAFTLDEHFQKKTKSNYFSSFFSRNDNSSQLNSICEAAAFLTATSKALPQILLSDQFILPLIHISKTSCGLSAIMSLKTLSNIAENSFESSQLLLSMELLPEIIKLALSQTDVQIKIHSMFLISSFAKFDHGYDVANSIFSFFYESSQITLDLLNISLRAFSFLSQHHCIFFNQPIFIDKLFDFVQVDCDLINSQCFLIFINLIHLDFQVIDHLFQIGVFSKIYDILNSRFSFYCIDFLEAVLIKTRGYDDIIFDQDFINLYENFLETENNENKLRIIDLIKISFLNSNVHILFSIYDSSIFNSVFEIISGSNFDLSISKSILIGIGRLFTLIGDECNSNDEYIQEYCEILEEIGLTDDDELNCLIEQFLNANSQQS